MVPTLPEYVTLRVDAQTGVSYAVAQLKPEHYITASQSHPGAVWVQLRGPFQTFEAAAITLREVPHTP